jgi:AAA domain
MTGTNGASGQDRAYDAYGNRVNYAVEEDLSGVLLSEVKMERTYWLWPGRIPLGAITLLDGDPGLGKSLISLDLAARVSTGDVMPDGAEGDLWEDPSKVLLLCAEDHPAATVRPRLIAAGANLENIVWLSHIVAKDLLSRQITKHPFQIPRDLRNLEAQIRESQAYMVVIDPLMAFLGRQVKVGRDQDVRAALAPLAAVAQRTRAAILVLRHLNKAKGTSALYRGGGSIGIIGAARSGLLVAKAPDDPDDACILASTKSNLGPLPPSLRFRLTARWLEDEGITTSRVDWQEASEVSAEQLVRAPSVAPAGPSPSKVQEATAWLTEMLSRDPYSGRQVELEATTAGISIATLRRAREKLGGRY